MGEFVKDRLPEALDYYESVGLTISRKGKWRTANCEFHGGSDSMRINTQTGAFVCMNCQAKGGDVLAYQMARHGQDFITAAMALNAWHDDGRPSKPQRPAPLPPRSALEVLGFEAMLAAVAAGNIANGVQLTDQDKDRLLVAAGRINAIREAYSCA